MSYNGYANYDTWNVMLWINNTESLYYAKQDYLESCASSGQNPSYVALIRDYFGYGAGDTTGDDVSWLADDLDIAELDAILLDEMKEL